MKYNEALKELEQIACEIESNATDIETLSRKLKRAQQLIALCQDKLTKADNEIKQILTDKTANSPAEQ